MASKHLDCVHITLDNLVTAADSRAAKKVTALENWNEKLKNIKVFKYTSIILNNVLTESPNLKP